MCNYKWLKLSQKQKILLNLSYIVVVQEIFMFPFDAGIFDSKEIPKFELCLLHYLIIRILE